MSGALQRPLRITREQLRWPAALANREAKLRRQRRLRDAQIALDRGEEIHQHRPLFAGSRRDILARRTEFLRQESERDQRGMKSIGIPKLRFSTAFVTAA